MTVVLETHELKKHFGAVRAVDGVNIKVIEGEFISLVGPNGSGKTTLLNLISGMLRPDHGKVVFMGLDVTNYPPHRRAKMGIARGFQLTTLFEGLSALDNVRLALISIKGLNSNATRPIDKYRDLTEEALKILELFNLRDQANRLVKELPHGQRKLLDIAIAFSLKPKLILLDEPTAGVSTKEKVEIMDLLRRILKGSNVTSIIVEHDMDIVYSYSERVIVMNRGQVVAVGKPEEVAQNPYVREVLLGG